MGRLIWQVMWNHNYGYIACMIILKWAEIEINTVQNLTQNILKAIWESLSVISGYLTYIFYIVLRN